VVVDAGIEADSPVEGSAFVGFAIVVIGGRAQRNLGTAADGATGEGVANAAAAFDESSGRSREAEEGEAGDGEENGRNLHLVITLQEGRSCCCCGGGRSSALRIVGGGGKAGWICGRERESSESGDCTDMTTSQLSTSPWTVVDSFSMLN
jgi:hypothetical protein